MWTNNALCCIKKKEKENQSDMRYGISWLKRSARERTKEEMNKFAKKAKIQVSAKRKKNIRDFFFFFKGNPNQR